jgi:uncharacterized membrane protein YoaK (UPF0700 family)
VADGKASGAAGDVLATQAEEDARRRERATQSLQHPLVRTLLVLTFSTGLVDAVCYLGLGRVFAANMTGNIVLLGFGIAGSGGLPVVAPLVSLGAFLLGAGVGGAVARRFSEHHAGHVARALALEASLIAAATVLAIVVSVRPHTVFGDGVIALLALAMGIRNATVRRLAVPDLTTTVLTLTLTGLAADSRLVGGTGKGTARRAAAVVAMLTGAIAGALLLKSGRALPLAAAAAAALVTWLAYVPSARRQRA